MKRYTGDLQSLFPADGNYTFLAGAGISMDPPTNLPSAREISRILVRLCTPEHYADELIGLDSFKYEQVIEHVQEFFDEDLCFLDYFDIVKRPNAIHLFLAQMIIQGHYVVTTNFDYVIEHALKGLAAKNADDKIVPVLTKRDFNRYEDPATLVEAGRYPIYKIHGSKKNIITDETTVESVITTISALGRNREKGKTFAIEPFKRPAMINLLKGRILVVMGYSGTDHFDIAPLLVSFRDYKRIIWIDHAPQRNTQDSDTPMIYKIEDSDSDGSARHLCKMLGQMGHQGDFDIFLIRGSTNEVLSTSMIPQLAMNGNFPQVQQNEGGEKRVSFQDWIKKVACYSNSELYLKYEFSATILRLTGHLESSLECLRQGLEHIHGENKCARSWFLNNKGLIYTATGKYDRAIQCYEEALEIEEQIGDPSGKIAPLTNLGQVYYLRDEYDKAFESDKRAIDIADRLDNRSLKATILVDIGLIHKTWGNFEKGIEYYTAALEIVEDIGELYGKSSILYNIGRIYQVQSDYEKAIEHYMLALAVDEHLGNLVGQASTLDGIGTIQKLQGNAEKAIQQYEHALEIDEQVGNQIGKAKHLNSIGVIYREKKDYTEALVKFTQVLEIADNLGNSHQKAITLNEIGLTYASRGEYEKALEQYMKAFELCDKLGILHEKATILDNIGQVYYVQHDYSKAFDYYKIAYKIAENLGDLRHTTIILNDLGLIHKSRNEYDEALAYYRRGLKMAEQLGDTDGTETLLNNIGEIYYEKEDYDKALEFFAQALEMAEKIGDLRGQAVELYNIACIHRNKKKHAKAIIKYMKAQSLYRQIGLEDMVQQIQKNIDKIKKNP